MAKVKADANKAVLSAKAVAARNAQILIEKTKKKMMHTALKAARALAQKEAQALVSKSLLAQQKRVQQIDKLLQRSARVEAGRHKKWHAESKAKNHARRAALLQAKNMATANAKARAAVEAALLSKEKKQQQDM